MWVYFRTLLSKSAELKKKKGATELTHAKERTRFSFLWSKLFCMQGCLFWGMKSESWGRGYDLSKAQKAPVQRAGTTKHLPDLGDARQAQHLTHECTAQHWEYPLLRYSCHCPLCLRFPSLKPNSHESRPSLVGFGKITTTEPVSHPDSTDQARNAKLVVSSKPQRSRSAAWFLQLGLKQWGSNAVPRADPFQVCSN